MPNVLLTRKCVRACPYCFAQLHMRQAPPDDVLGWEDFIYIVDFFQSNGRNHLSLLGGEPLLHKELPAMVRYLDCRGMRATLFTSGICGGDMRAKLEESLKDLSPDVFSIVVNYNNPEDTPAAENESIDTFFKTFAPYVSLGINVYKLGFDYGYALRTIVRQGLQKRLRIGLAHPVSGTRGASISPTPDMMKRMGTEFTEAIPAIADAGIEVHMDCGFPLCAFSDQELGMLYRYCAEGLRFDCGPAIDIGPDLKVWNCFPLAGHGDKSLLDFDNCSELDDYFRNLVSDIRCGGEGMYEQCVRCPERERGRCSGGCVSHLLDRKLNSSKSDSNHERI